MMQEKPEYRSLMKKSYSANNSPSRFSSNKFRIKTTKSIYQSGNSTPYRTNMKIVVNFEEAQKKVLSGFKTSKKTEGKK